MENDASVHLNQGNLVEKSLMVTRMNKSRPMGGRIYESLIAASAKSDILNEHEHTIYHRIVRSLLYLATRT